MRRPAQEFTPSPLPAGQLIFISIIFNRSGSKKEETACDRSGIFKRQTSQQVSQGSFPTRAKVLVEIAGAGIHHAAKEAGTMYPPFCHALLSSNAFFFILPIVRINSACFSLLKSFIKLIGLSNGGFSKSLAFSI